MVGKRWRGYGGDITAAFLQGEPLPRDKPLYIWLPKKMPEEVVKYVEGKLQGHRTDLVKMVKGVFGLNESPRLWYPELDGIFKSSDSKSSPWRRVSLCCMSMAPWKPWRLSMWMTCCWQAAQQCRMFGLNSAAD